MLKTFAAPDEDRFVEDADLQGVDGRLIWDETEIELCAVGIGSAGVGVVQISKIFPTTEEGCGPNTETQQTFDDFGVPETACVHVRWSSGAEDEYCAPLVVD
ncbi:MAG: hypothetical protein P8N02_00470 [Actinomycetota bacterium]|jgi:hypothetical protein|nr:hypothetical protein [Actinomycetota bacterium]